MSTLAALRGRPSAARLGVLVVALIVCAWYILGIREFGEQVQVKSLAFGHAQLTAAQARAAGRTLDEAQILNPDQSVESLRAIVASKAGDYKEALTIAEAMTRREPQDLEAWKLVSVLVQETHSAMLRSVEAHIEALSPPVASSR